MLGTLDGQTTGGAGSPVDEHILAGHEPRPLGKRGPGRDSGIDDRGGGQVIDRVGNRNATIRMHCDPFGHGAKRRLGQGEEDPASIGPAPNAIHTRNKWILPVRTVVRAGGATFGEVAKRRRGHGD
jgi:hypothetical protein